jgi:hypothetical protein
MIRSLAAECDRHFFNSIHREALKTPAPGDADFDA